MKRVARQIRLSAASILLVVAAFGAGAVVPLLLAGLGKQIVEDMITNAIKGQLIASLSSMGCKGARLAGVLATIDVHPGRSGRLPMGMPPGFGAGPPMPGGMPPGLGGAAGAHLPPGLPGGAAGLTGAAGRAGAAGADLAGAAGQAEAVLGGGQASARFSGADTHGAGVAVSPAQMARIQGGQMDMGQMMALAQRQMAGRAPGQAQMTPEQMAAAQETMVQLQEAMAHPLTREQTLGLFDDLKELGVLTDEMNREARECIVLSSPEASQGIGQTGSMMQSVVLPKLRSAKEHLAGLPPDQQQQLADEIVNSLQNARAGDRKTFLEGLGLGFFPPGVSEAVRAKMQR
jgi:hypothetical protein